MKVTFNNVVYIVKKINGAWRFKEMNGAGANGWRFVRNAQATNVALAQALINAIGEMYYAY